MPYKRIKEKVRSYFYEVARLKKTPHEIALGFAVGVFIGVLPTPGFNIIIALLTIFIYKKLNKLAIFGGMALFNPLVTPFTLFLANKIGKIFVNPLDPTDHLYSLVKNVLNTTLRILVGSLIIATVSAFISYFIVKKIVIKIQEKA